ncbi:MAG: AI-2E family transporter [Sulfuricellaceae bacterium]|nr:AI-2E family transporter [Sulfuricellaceae bacterium]
MNNFYNTAIVSILFTLTLLLAAFAVLKPFLLAILWAAIIALASWPLHRKILAALGGRSTLSAAVSTLVIAISLVAPMVLLAIHLIIDVNAVIAYLLEADAMGKAAPVWLDKVPVAGAYLLEKWEIILAQPHQLSTFAEEWMSTQFNLAQKLAQLVVLDFTGRLATLAFALWVLFFFYRDGDFLIRKINIMGYKWLQRRWPSYSHSVPSAVKGAVNGLVVIGFGEAIIFSALFEAVSLPSAFILGVLAAILALIPLAAPLMLALIAVLLSLQGLTMTGIYIFIFGTAVIMAADYVIRPWMIQGSTELPFLAVLFGFLGGIASMGIVGLIIGPVILALFNVLLREASIDESVDLGV